MNIIHKYWHKISGVTVFAMLLLAGCASTPGSLNPVTAKPTDSYHPGKFVWHDLLTNDIAQATDFYGELFGWTFQNNKGYTLILNNNMPIGTILALDSDAENPTITAVTRWVSSLSVADIDQAVAFVQENGGTIHENTEIPGRGRYALISDPQGAELALLRSSSGDPPDAEPAMGAWLWTELWSNDPDTSLTFYQRLADYQRQRVTFADKTAYWRLIKDNKWRAGILQMPWPDTTSRWVPDVRVADIQAIIGKVEALGGEVVIGPEDPQSDGTAALILDPAGAAFLVEQWR